jgi:ATP-dependent helicase HrpA
VVIPGAGWSGSLPILSGCMGSSLSDVRSRLPGLTLRDQHRLRRRLDGVRGVRDPERREDILAKVAADVEAAELRVALRREAVPEVTYPEALPVSRRKDEIREAIAAHQVVIVAGETGSGKTTQLPKICLELGLGVKGLIGHTQPRRLAARTVAERIAEELNVPLGEAVGYQVRFTDHSGDDTLVKVMTDGILLNELARDRMLRRYDTLIIDEAHERSLNIDFILGYLKRLLPRRPDLKVIITSATIDPERFSRHFGDAPIIEVSGRTYPVEVRYRPMEDDDDQTQAILNAVDELALEPPGDVLVFLSGEREIRDTADALEKRKLRDTEILPLYARLSAAEQHRVFQPRVVSGPQKGAHPHRPGRRIVLATNVAETSLTVPGIKYVIDPGFARISRYSHRTKVQRLPIEPVSQASADQRKGRCGRVSDGVCIRLYSEEDFLARPEFTDPEILRTNLASVILQMTSLGLGEVLDFPFIDPPDRRNVKDGVNLLEELGALSKGELTPLGRKLAQLPVDPRLARMVLEADRNGCVREVMVIAAALSIQDPRERPADKRQAADEKHARFADKESDFSAYLNLWDYLRERQKELSGNQFRRLCKQEYLHYLRVREWQDIFGQLRQVGKDLGVTMNSAPADPRQVHIALLSGLLSHIGLLDEGRKDPDKRRGPREYDGARNARFALFPASSLAKKPPRWVMAAELVETSRLWARIAARIEPEWVEPLAGHLVKRTYSEPHWEKNQGAVMAYEKVTLYGVPIVAERKVGYAKVDPELCRDLFIRNALVEGDWDTHHRFLRDNRRLLEEAEELEHRARRRDIVVDDETLFEFYDERIPPSVVSARHFDSWWKKARRDDPELLTFSTSMLVGEAAGEVTQADYPDAWQVDGQRLRLSYQFEPGTEADGVTVQIPLPVLNQVDATGFDWQIPGLREDLVTELIRSLPKRLRVNFVPAPDVARSVLARIEPGSGPLLESLSRELRAMTGVEVPPDAWDLDRVPDHLKMTYRVVDRRKTLAEGKDLAELKRRLAPKVSATLSRASDAVERSQIRTWDFGELPRVYERGRVKAYPALSDEGDSVAIRTYATEAEQRRAMWRGTRRLVLLNSPSPARLLQSKLSNRAKLVLAGTPHGSVPALLDDCVMCAADKLITDFGGPAWDEAGFVTLKDKVRADLTGTTEVVFAHAQRILAEYHQVESRLKATTSPRLASSVADVRAQLSRLVFPGFVTAAGFKRLPDLLRYLRAVDRRLERLPDDPHRDEERMREIRRVEAKYVRARDAAPGNGKIREVRWMLEELRVSFFAQQLGTAYPISEKRIQKALDQATS